MFENPINTSHKTRRVDIYKRTIRGNKSLNKSLQKKCAFLLVLIATLLIGWGVYFYLKVHKDRQHLPNQESNIENKPYLLEPHDKQPTEPNDTEPTGVNEPSKLVPIKAKDTFLYCKGKFRCLIPDAFMVFTDIKGNSYKEYPLLKKNPLY